MRIYTDRKPPRPSTARREQAIRLLEPRFGKYKPAPGHLFGNGAIGDEEDSHLGDFVEDKSAILPIDAAIQSNLRETTTRVLASLTPREERVLRMRFGIGMNG